jgi:hypothetical protein
MKKFVLLSSGGSMPETEAETAEFMKAWETWYTSLGSNVVDAGNPLSPVAKISDDGSVSDGSVDTMTSGYLILSAESSDQAVKMAKDCPVLLSGSEITLFEAFEVM